MSCYYDYNDLPLLHVVQLHIHDRNYTELVMKPAGLEANYQSVRLYRSVADQGLQWPGSGTVRHTTLATSPPQGRAGRLTPDLEFTAQTVTALLDS